MERIKNVNPDSPVALFIKASRKALDMTGQQFGDAFGASKASVSAWEVGANEPNGFEKLVAISHRSGVPLPGVVQSRAAFEPVQRTPVLGDARLGDQGFYETTPALNGSDGWVEYPWTQGTYALRCKGDSMWPRIKHGEYVVIDPNERLGEGDDVACQTVDGRRMIKVFNRKFADGSVELTSVNGTHPPITFDNDEILHMHAVAAILRPSKYHPDL